VTTYFEELETGSVFGGQTYAIDEAEMVAFAEQWDPRPLHLEHAAAVGMGFPTVIASGSYTTAVFTRLIKQAREEAGNHATLAVVRVTNSFPKPVLGGDVLRFDAEIAEKRESRSRPNAGIIVTKATLTNQRDEVAMESEVVTLVQRRPA
jgi:acyl dehydratase